jgi:hypothetical protein
MVEILINKVKIKEWEKPLEWAIKFARRNPGKNDAIIPKL